MEKAMLTITALIENTTRSTALACEYGLSLLLTCEGRTMLFDTGASNAFLRNAEVMGVDMDAVSAIVLSHGHYDHTGGLEHALRHFAQGAGRSGEGSRRRLPELIAHPDILLHRRLAATEKGAGKYLGIPEPALALLRNWPLRLEKKPLPLTENLFYLGEIPRKYADTQALLGEIARDGVYEKDRILDDSALAYVHGKGRRKALTVIAGCAHAGIINTIEYARAVTGVSRVHAVIGGLHMKGAAESVKEQTLKYFAEQDVEMLRGCHCTGNALDGSAQQKPLHTGDCLEIV
jgi:7,8-dihydropterin-6-yl-methyl-4-(beta-D-ribofuranosyl)aminobenzene 5'-phosphate synthase